MDRAQALLLIGIKVSLSREKCLHALPPLERIPTEARTILELGCDIEAVVAGINHVQRQGPPSQAQSNPAGLHHSKP